MEPATIERKIKVDVDLSKCLQGITDYNKKETETMQVNLTPLQVVFFSELLRYQHGTLGQDIEFVHDMAMYFDLSRETPTDDNWIAALHNVKDLYRIFEKFFDKS